MSRTSAWLLIFPGGSIAYMKVCRPRAAVTDGIELAHRARSRAARVGVSGFSRLVEARVGRGERPLGKVDLATHLELIREAGDTGSSVIGTERMVRTFAVTSSPSTPLPRVAART